MWPRLCRREEEGRRRPEGRSEGRGHALATLPAPRPRAPRTGPGQCSQQVLLGAERDLPPRQRRPRGYVGACAQGKHTHEWGRPKHRGQEPSWGPAKPATVDEHGLPRACAGAGCACKPAGGPAPGTRSQESCAGSPSRRAGSPGRTTRPPAVTRARTQLRRRHWECCPRPPGSWKAREAHAEPAEAAARPLRPPEELGADAWPHGEGPSGKGAGHTGAGVGRHGHPEH